MTANFRTRTENLSSKTVCSFRITAFFLIISLFSAILFEVIHSGHDEHCHEEDCPVCFVLQVIHSTKKISFSAPVASVGVFVYCFINILILSAILPVPATLVSQKIKLVI